MEEHFPFSKVPLGCEYISLVPQCNPDTLYFHHVKVYGGYVDTLNYLLAKAEGHHDRTLSQLIFEDLPGPIAYQNAVRYYAGGVYSHNLYFSMLTGHSSCQTRGKQEPFGRMAMALGDVYGSIQNFKRLFIEAALANLGPGWTWLVAEDDGTPHIVITQANNVPAVDSLHPVFVADTWEHTYYLQYPARLDLYLTAWFGVLDWGKVERNYQMILRTYGHTL